MYMHDKYCKNIHPTDVVVTSAATKIWKHMLKARDRAEDKCMWLLGDGNIHISKDKWVSCMPSQVQDMTVKELLYLNGDPNEGKILEICGPQVLLEIKQKALHLKGGKDTLIWTVSSNSGFTFEFAWNIVRQKNPHCTIGKYAWHPHFQLKFHFYMESMQVCHTY